MASSHSFVDKSTQSLVLDIVDFTSIYSSITEVIEKNPDCIIDGKYKDGVLVINIDARKQDYHQQLGLSQITEIHWGKEYTVPKNCPGCPGQSDMK